MRHRGSMNVQKASTDSIKSWNIFVYSVENRFSRKLILYSTEIVCARALCPSEDEREAKKWK